MTKAPKVIKCRNMMYVQQLKHLPKDMTVESLFTLVDEKIRPKKWAGIVHDKDNKPDKTPAEPQVHVMMQFENARSLEQVAKEIGDEPQYIQKWDARPTNGFAYLIHATSGARHLHQYSADEVTANFDYMEEIEKAAVKFAERSTSKDKINHILDMIAKGEISLKHAKDLLYGSEYAKAEKKLDAAHSLYLERCSNAFCEIMKNNNQTINVNWIYGDTETGKTVLAKKAAASFGDYYKTTTVKDPFQFYQAEPVIILDELRPASIPYSEILAMFDPFSGGKVTMSSRYYNKALSCHTFFVTTPYSPETFYKRTVPHFEREIDRQGQFFRRLTSVLHLTLDTIEKMEYNESLQMYCKTDEKPNRYSKKNYKPIVTSHLFDEIE